MSDLVRIPNCWFSHDAAQIAVSNITSDFESVSFKPYVLHYKGRFNVVKYSILT